MNRAKSEGSTAVSMQWWKEICLRFVLNICSTCLLDKKRFFKKSLWWIVSCSNWPQISIFFVFSSLGIFSISLIANSGQWSFLTITKSFQRSEFVATLSHSRHTSVAVIKSSYWRYWKIVKRTSKGKGDIFKFVVFSSFFQFRIIFAQNILINCKLKSNSRLRLRGEINRAANDDYTNLPAFLSNT